MSKELRHIHLSSGLVVAIMAADVIDLARERIIYDCTDGHDLHIDPEADYDVEGIEKLLASVAKAHQISNQPAVLKTVTVDITSGGGGGGGASAGRIFGGGKVSDAMAGAKVSEKGGEPVITHKAYAKMLLKGAITAGYTKSTEAADATKADIEAIQKANADKITTEEFAGLLREVAEEVAVDRLTDMFKKSFGF